MKIKSAITGLILIWGAIFLTSCQEKATHSKGNAEVTAHNLMAMSGCDSTCMASCCTYPDKETGACLCAKKGKDCDAHCCAAHAKGSEGQSHGGRHNHKGGEHGHREHRHDTLTAK